MVAGHAQGRADNDHVAHQPHGIQNARASVDQIANEDCLATCGVSVGTVAPERRMNFQRVRLIAQLLEQGFKLVAATVNVADDVERAMFLPPVVPEWHPLNCSCFDLLGSFEHEDMPKAFSS